MSKPTLLALLVPALLGIGGLAPGAETAAKAVPVPAGESAPLPKAAPTKPAPPPPAATTAYLVDRVIPAYGTPHQRPYYADSRVTGLYQAIQHKLAGLEAKIMAGEGVKPPLGKDGKPLPPAKFDPKAPPVLSEDAQIQLLLAELVDSDQRLKYRNFLEQWQIDHAFSDLYRAAEMLRLRGEIPQTTFNKVTATAPLPAVKPAARPAAPAAVPAVDAPPTPVAPARPAPAPVVEAPEAPPADMPEAPAPETPADMPAEAPAPEETPSDMPAEAPAPEETPSDMPAEAPAPEDAPTDMPEEAPAPEDAPADMPEEAPAPEDAPTDMPTEAPAPEEAPAEPSAESIPGPETMPDSVPPAEEAPPEPAQ